MSIEDEDNTREWLLKYFGTFDPNELRGMRVVMQVDGIRTATSGVIESVVRAGILLHDCGFSSEDILLAVRIDGKNYASIRLFSWWRKKE